MNPVSQVHRSTVAVATAVGAIGLTALPISRPLILPDEAGFLLNARRIATGSAPSGLDYFPGYSVVLAPAAAISTDIHTLSRMVQVVNGLLAVATALLAMALARRLAPTLRESSVAIIGLVVSTYPAYRLFASFALSENLLVPWTVLLCLLFHRAIRRPDIGGAVVFGLAAGLSLSIHTRAIALPLAASLSSLVLLRGQRLLGATVGLIIGVGVALALVVYTLDTPVDPGTARDSPSSLLGDALSPSGLFDVFTSAAGQIFYLLAATAGLAGLGMWAFVDTLRSWFDKGDDTARAAAAIPLLAVLMSSASLGISSLFLAGREGDFAIYGRYGEGVLLPLVVAGLVTLALGTPGTTGRTVRLAMTLAFLGGALLILRGPEAFQGRTLLLNIAGIFPVVDLVGSIRLSSITFFGVCFVISTGAALRWRFEAGAAALAVVFLATGMFAINRSAAAIEVLDRQDELVTDIAAFADDVDCIALDIWQLPDRWHQENYRLTLNQTAFEYWSSATPDPPCSELVVSRRSDLDDLIPGASVIAVEPFGRQALWVLPGTLQTRLDRGDDPTIPDPLAPLAPEQRTTVKLDLRTTTFEIGSPAGIEAVVDNLGPAGFFPPNAFGDDVGSINLGLEFRLADDAATRRHEPYRVRLPEPLAAGERIELAQMLSAEQIDPGITPGRYLLVASVVQEGVGWTEFSDAVAVEVRR